MSNEYINEKFISLIDLAKDDESVKIQLMAVLELDSFSRKFLLKEIISNMKKNNEPQDLIEAFLLLEDDNIAKRAIEVIKDKI